MEIREIEDKNILNQFADSLLEKWEWGEFKKKYGWRPLRLAICKGPSLAEPAFATQILIKKLPFGFSFFYCPTHLPDKKILKALLEKIRELANQENTIFCQMNILDETMPQKEKELLSLGFKKSFEEIQPKNTLILDLTKSEEEILKQMKPKGRYNIKVAQKHGVVVKEIKNLKEFSDYGKIHEETIKRDKISARPFEYLKNLFQMLKENNLGTAFIAYYKNRPIAGIIVSLAGEKATYMYGASLYDYRNLMSTYLLQWQAMKYAKEKGAKIYDLFGIAPTDDPKHKWAGITRFKKQFGGKGKEILGSYDLVFKPFFYNLFKLAMKLRKLK